jgi:hypothetical protein
MVGLGGVVKVEHGLHGIDGIGLALRISLITLQNAV